MPSMDLTPEEARHIRRRRMSEKRDRYFQEGLKAAAEVVEEMVDGEASAVIVDTILGLKRPRKKDRKEPPAP